MKTLLKSYLNKKFSITFYVSFLILLNLPISSYAENNYCGFVSKAYGKNLKKNLKQDPFAFVKSILDLSIESHKNKNLKLQNDLMSASFDLGKIYKANAQKFRSKIVSNDLFDWLRTQYFGNLENTYLQKNTYLLKKHHDLLTELERTNMQNFKPKWTGIEKLRCSKKESLFLGCKKELYKLTVQLLPEISCKSRALKKAFETNFYLTFSKKYGFKILDLDLSGKRLVMDSVELMTRLKQKGFNTRAISNHLAVLSKNSKTFKLPKRQIHAERFLAKFKKVDEDRVPASL